MKHLHTFEEFLQESVNEFGPLAGSGNVRANDIDNIKREAAKKSERGETVYVIGGKYGSYKLSKKFEEGNTYAAYYNGMPQVVESLNEEFLNEKIEYPEGVKTTGDKILDKLAKLLNSPKGTIEIGSGSVRGKRVPFANGDAYFNITGYRDHWNILCSNGDFEIPRKEIKNAEVLFDQIEKAIQIGTVTIGKKK